MKTINQQPIVCLRQPKYGQITIFFRYQEETDKAEIDSTLQQRLGIKVDYSKLEMKKYYRIIGGEVTPKLVGSSDLARACLQKGVTQEFNGQNISLHLSHAQAMEAIEQGYILANQQGDLFSLSDNNEITIFLGREKTFGTLVQLPRDAYILFDKRPFKANKEQTQTKRTTQKEEICHCQPTESNINSSSFLHTLMVAGAGISLILAGIFFFKH